MIVSVDDLAEASLIVIVAGVNPEVASAESPLTLSEMLPVNPPAGVAVIVKVVASVGFIVRVAGVAPREKSVAGVASAIFAMNASWLPPFAPCKGDPVVKLVEEV